MKLLRLWMTQRRGPHRVERLEQAAVFKAFNRAGVPGLVDSRSNIEMQPDRQFSETRRSVFLRSGTALPRDGDYWPNFERARQPGSSLIEDQLDLSITEIAIVWILHYGMLPHSPLQSLTRDIVDFYPAALHTILRVEALRNAKQSELRLIYFKGLIVSQTHPKSEMVEAVRRADRSLEAGALSSERSEPSQRRSTIRPPSDDQDTLAHIADALGSLPGSAH